MPPNGGQKGPSAVCSSRVDGKGAYTEQTTPDTETVSPAAVQQGTRVSILCGIEEALRQQCIETRLGGSAWPGNALGVRVLKRGFAVAPAKCPARASPDVAQRRVNGDGGLAIAHASVMSPVRGRCCPFVSVITSPLHPLGAARRALQRHD